MPKFLNKPTDSEGNVLSTEKYVNESINTVNTNTENTYAKKDDIPTNYAGSSTAGGSATSAVKLDSSAGSATQPVYFSNGKPVKTTYTLAKSVPSNAVFTDTKYTHPSYTAQDSGLYKVTVDSTGHVSSVEEVVKSDITALGIPASDTNTHYTSKNVVNSSSTSTSNTTTALTNGNVYLISVENGAVTSAHKITGSGATTVTTDSSGNIVISSTDTKYTHPTTSGNKHIPSGGSSGKILRWSADGTAVWGADNNTDTKVNVTLGTTTKAYLLGTSTKPTSTATGVTAISDTGVYLDTTAGKLTATTFSGALSGNASTATKLATARTISLGSGLQGSTTFDGSANVTLSGSLKRCYFVDSNSNWNTYPWFKIADVTSTVANDDANITFLVTCGWTTAAMGILRARIRSGSTVGTYGLGNLMWELLTIDTNYINPSNFVMVYTSTSGTSLKAELWVKNTAQYNSYMFTVLDESTRSSFTSKWNIYTNPTHVSSYTSGTGTITSKIVSILNNSATATALTTSAGSATRPVYFSDGKPKVCDYTLGAACARNVTTASNKTHTSFGTNNNYVPDMAFLSYWNGAYSSSGASNLSYCTKGAFGDAAIKGVDTTATSGSTNLITSGAMYTALAGKAASSHTHSYLPLSGGAISSSSYGPLTIERTGSTNAAGIVFKNSSGKLGSIAMSSTGYDGLIRYDADGTRYDILDTGNAFTTTTPKANGTAAVGSANTVSRSDHVHPLQTTVSGNAGTATKWATARNINGLSVDGSANRVNYGTCSTAAATAAKVVSCTGFALITGSEITVKFTVTNTASSPTLNVNGTGNKAIKYRGSNITAGYLTANRTYTFRYDGTNYDLVGDLNTDTNTYVTQKDSTANASLRLLLSYSANNTGTTNTVNKSANFLANPSTGCLTAKMFKGTYVLLYDSAISGSTATITITNLWNYSILFVTIFDIEGGMGRVDKYPIAIQKLNASTSNVEVVRYFGPDGAYTNYTDYFIKFQKSSSTANSLSVSTSGVDKIGKLRIEALI